ncbi:MAG: cob(I)yrinic acid a,c-diamide adenosyltransferase [Firmicutes bacterium]|nr:cob(I)yrinic acid a,c-diamide adenosyltransferase [Bacillota bacterium]
MIQVYTGDGKGKTSAAMGLAVRAKGQGLKVGVFQFLKAGETGEKEALRALGILFQQYGSGRWLINREPDKEEIALALKGLADVAEAIAAGFQVLILDEISHALNYGLLPLEKVLALARTLPAECELVLTGRDFPAELLALADLVTEMRAVKHPYARGIGPRRGIEY